MEVGSIIMSMTGQCRRQDNVASLRVLVSKPDLPLAAAAGFAMRDVTPSATLCRRRHCPVMLFNKHPAGSYLGSGHYYRHDHDGIITYQATCSGGYLQ